MLIESEDDFDIKDVAHPSLWVIRSTTEKDEQGHPLYWNNQDGWVTYAEADVFHAEDGGVALPLGGQWWPVNEAQAQSISSTGDLREKLTPEMAQSFYTFFNELGFLVEQEWRPMGTSLAMLREDKTIRVFFNGPTLTLRATMSLGESSRVHEGEIGNAKSMANELNGELAKLLPEGVRTWPTAPVWDKFNRQWTFRFNVVMGEGIDDMEGEYKDLFTTSVPPDFAKPRGLSPEGEKAWEIIVTMLRDNDDLKSGGHTKVFYTPEEWKAKREDYGEGSQLIVVHDGGQHAPYFNSDFGAPVLPVKMDLALRRHGLYLQQMTSWGTAIYTCNPVDPETEAELEKWINSRTSGSEPDLDRLIVGSKEHMKPAPGDTDEPPIEEAAENELDDVARSPIEQMILDAGFEIIGTKRSEGGTTAQGLYSTVIYTKPPPPVGNQDPKAVAFHAAKELSSKLGNEMPQLRPISYNVSTLDLRGPTVIFWITQGKVQEASEDFELTEPSSNEGRIRQLFTTVGLHIDSMIEEPRGDEPGWGTLNDPKRVITAVAQPSEHESWRVDSTGSIGLADFCRQISSSLGEILGTMDIDWTTRWDDELGAWRVKWFIGDTGITKHRVVETYGDLEGDEDLVKDVSSGGDKRDRFRIGMELMTQASNQLVDIPKEQWWDDDVDFYKLANEVVTSLIKSLEDLFHRQALDGFHGLLVASIPKPWNYDDRISRGYARELVQLFYSNSKRIQQEAVEPGEDDWKVVTHDHTTHQEIERAMAEHGILSIMTRPAVGSEDHRTPGLMLPGQYRLFMGMWRKEATIDDAREQLFTPMLKEFNKLGLTDVKFYFRNGDATVAVKREELGESVQEGFDEDEDEGLGKELMGDEPVMVVKNYLFAQGFSKVKIYDQSDINRYVVIAYAKTDPGQDRRAAYEKVSQDQVAPLKELLRGNNDIFTNWEPKNSGWVKYSYVIKTEPQQEALVEPVQLLIEAGALVRKVEETEQELTIEAEWTDTGPFTVKLPLQESVVSQDDFAKGIVAHVIGEDSQEGDDNRVAIVGVFREYRDGGRSGRKKEQGYEVLVCKREVDPEAGKWCIPGGHAKKGEDIATAAKREMNEETHLELGELTFVKKMPNETREAVVSVYGTMMPEGDKAKAGDDAEKLKWVPVDDLPDLAFDNNKLVKEIADKMGINGKVEESIVAWHASPNKFRKFDTSREGAHFGSREQADNLRKHGLHAAKPYILDLKNPARLHDIGVWSNFDNLRSALHLADLITDEQADAAWQAWQRSDDEGYEVLKAAMEANGYDGIVYANEQEGEGDSYLIFRERQIKPYRHGVMESKSKKGFLIVFEGIDGAGKTTQVRRLSDWLNDHGHHFVTTKWNSSKLLSDILWKAKRKKDLTPMLFSLLHASDLHLRYEKIIMPALAEDKIVLADRYYYTSYVRDQIRGIDDELLDYVYEDFIEPDLIFHCVVPPKVAVERLMNDRGAGFYASGQDVDYGVKGKEASLKKYEEDMAGRYGKLFKDAPNVVELEMDRPIRDIAKDIKVAVRKLLGMEESLQEFNTPLACRSCGAGFMAYHGDFGLLNKCPDCGSADLAGWLAGPRAKA